MMSIRRKLEDVGRKAVARMPGPARDMLQRLDAAVRARRGAPPPPSTEAAPVPAAAAPVEAPAPKPINWELRSQAEIVEHIEKHYHAGLRRDLPVLVSAARRVEREHAGHAAVPKGLADLLESFASELESHMMKEERVLFPTLRTGSRGGPVDMPIRMMEREHEGHDDALAQIRQLTRDHVAPDDAPAAWKDLYSGLAALDNDLRQHIYLENNVLFARALGGEY